ncbi:hypothetical protein EW026_g2253 [Hermanssonia centrifuga]|uniref:ABC transporter domain-containing protein n=1 Tax=Hermanssonia centrifuga TaxID=98765 RepID=A0A4S4KPM0_9APHY|nr:hypothetical protein EW026_g2253 [Hermanssonia centrifuga]
MTSLPTEPDSGNSDQHPPSTPKPAFFDPQAISDLRKTVSRMSEHPQHDEEQTGQDELAVPRSRTRTSSVSGSDLTLTNVNLDVGPFDFEKFLQSLIKRLDKSAHIKRRELGVLFKDLRVVGLGASMSYQPTLASQFSPSNFLNTIHKLRHPPTRDLISGFEGVVRPGEMLLVLGRPGAGCSTFLRALSSQHSAFHSLSGTLAYDSLPSSSSSSLAIPSAYKADVLYCPEEDLHFPTLTVAETLAFAAYTRTPARKSRPDISHAKTSAGKHGGPIPGKNEDAASREECVDLMVEVLLTVFGLRGVRDTKVGDAWVRGVSGGQKKRVSICEALASRGRVCCWDNSTRGLDASTALEFVQALRIATDIARMTTVVSIYQAGESLYDLFDKVCVIYEGKMAYYGPANQARQYFIDMGYEPANRQTTADFLVAVTDPSGRIPRSIPPKHPLPRSAAEFAAYYLAAPVSATNRADMDEYEASYVGKEERERTYRDSVLGEHVRGHGLSVLSAKKERKVGSPFVISVPMMARALMKRRVMIMKGDALTQVLNFLTFVVQAIIMGTVFFRLENSTSKFYSRGGVLFFSILFSALTTMAEIPALFSQRPIVLRQSTAAMYHPFVEALALTLVDAPITFVTLVAFTIILYFLERAPAQTVAGMSILVLTLYTGYTIPQPSMIGALRWITYINPLKYGFEGLLVNELHKVEAQCATLIPQGPGYDGKITLANQNFGIICAFGAAFITAYFLFTQFNTKSAGETSVVLFKRGSKATALKQASEDVKGGGGGDDEEKAHGHSSSSTVEPSPALDLQAGVGFAGEKEGGEAVAAAPAMTDVFSWQHIEYTVPLADGTHRRLLDDVSGFVAPGKLTALMGESGAGKVRHYSTERLAERTNVGVVRGDRFVNGQALPDDFEAQTVEKCLDMCGLTAYADAVVGTLNVEYRKRTTIAVELVAKPRLLLFLDEPTSGLDSQSAWAIVAFLRELADKAGQAILCTIHQPSGELFQVFDRLLLLRTGGQTVYFGDIGYNSSTMIQYFERYGARQCHPDENPAEYILQVIGAGATATADRDWHAIWKESGEAVNLQKEIDSIHEEGRKRPPVETALHSKYPTSWGYQVATLLKRDFEVDFKAHWRDPTFVMSKIALNIVAGLFIGFTFFKSKDTLQGTQNKLFSIFMATVISVPLAQQLQVPFIYMRDLYEILAEAPWNMLGSSVFFLCWYWTVGYSSEASRAGYTYLFLGVVFPLYYTTVGQAIAAMSPNVQIAALLFSFLFSFVLIFNGVLQPFRQLGWWKWMYRVSPYSYLIEGLLGSVIGRQTINCSEVEFVHLTPPSGSTCSQYLQPFINVAGGYLQDANASSACAYCPYSTTDQYLSQNFSIEYGHRWRDLGIFLAFVAFNICAIYAFTYFFRIRSGNLVSSLKKRFETRKMARK